MKIVCKFHIIDKTQTLSNLNPKGLSYFSCMNTCSVLKNIEKLEYLIEKAKVSANICWSSRRLREILKTCPEHVFNTSSA